MPTLRKSALCALLLAASFAVAQAGHPSIVQRVVLAGRNPLQIKIETSSPVKAEAQIVTGPERLVLDIPNAMPGAALHGFPIRSGEARSVRTSLFSTSPPVTRVVVDLSAPQWYRVTPDSAGLLVTFGSAQDSEAASQPTIGWVSARMPLSTASGPVVPNRRARTPVPAVKGLAVAPHAPDGVTVQFDAGKIAIHARNASLSEVLYQIQKTTGAEMAIPSGTEQERVAGDFGPGTPSEVLAQLLNGSGLNFVVIGSANDPNALRSVVLSRNTGPADSPASFASVPAPTVAEGPAEAAETAVPAAEDNAPPPAGTPAPANGQQTPVSEFSPN